MVGSGRARLLIRYYRLHDPFSADSVWQGSAEDAMIDRFSHARIKLAAALVAGGGLLPTLGFAAGEPVAIVKLMRGAVTVERAG